MLAFAAAAGIYAQDDYYESKPLYSLPKIIEAPKNDLGILAKKTASQEDAKPLPGDCDMNGLFSADIENRGLVLDPRTKLAVTLTLVIFALGNAGSNITAVRYGTIALCFLPIVLLVTAKQYRKAAIAGGLYMLIKAAEILLVPQLKGPALSMIGVICLVFVRLMPGLIMGSYMLSSTTVSEFIAAMHRMHMPQQITIPMSVMFRFFPTVLEEFGAQDPARRNRGQLLSSESGS